MRSRAFGTLNSFLAVAALIAIPFAIDECRRTATYEELLCEVSVVCITNLDGSYDCFDDPHTLTLDRDGRLAIRDPEYKTWEPSEYTGIQITFSVWRPKRNGEEDGEDTLPID
jgi:hypothetical protein